VVKCQRLAQWQRAPYLEDGCPIHSHWVNCRSAPWASVFTSTALARSTIQASVCRQLTKTNNKKSVYRIQHQNNIPYLFDGKPRLIVFFHHFVRLIIKGGLHFLFLCLVERYRSPRKASALNSPLMSSRQMEGSDIICATKTPDAWQGRWSQFWKNISRTNEQRETGTLTKLMQQISASIPMWRKILRGDVQRLVWGGVDDGVGRGQLRSLVIAQVFKQQSFKIFPLHHFTPL